MSNILKVLSPYDDELLEELPLVGEQEVEEAISSAYKLFKDRSAWIAKHKRIEILDNLAAIMAGKVEELTKIAAAEGGKPYTDSKVEVLRAINGVKLASQYIGQIKGEEIPMGLTKASVGRMAFTMREPIGVVASVSAFNHPLNLTVHQTVPAFAAGAPVIIKPASTTPLSCLNFVKMFEQAGLPSQWVQAIICGRKAAEKLVTDKRINYLSFIGSDTVGWYLRSKLSPGTRCALEHGGVAPVIFEKDADLESAVPLLVKGGFYHAGQVCVSVQKVFVHQDRAEDLTEKITAMARSLKIGHPLEPETEVGPLIENREVDRVEEWVIEARNKGGKITTGGSRTSASCYQPTVIYDPPAETQVSTHEIFGPVVCIYPYTDRLEAINRANSLSYAFQASVFTKNLDLAIDTVNRLNATAVMVNDHTAFRVDWMPFGGRDSSGIGMGGIPYSIHEMTREKLMVIKSPEL